MSPNTRYGLFLVRCSFRDCHVSAKRGAYFGPTVAQINLVHSISPNLRFHLQPFHRLLWLSQSSPPTISLALKSRKLFLTTDCIASCSAGTRAPSNDRLP